MKFYLFLVIVLLLDIGECSLRIGTKRVLNLKYRKTHVSTKRKSSIMLRSDRSLVKDGTVENRNSLKSKDPIDKYNIQERIKKFSTSLAKYFVKFAGYGYCRIELMNEGKCCNEFFKDNEYILETAYAIEDNYNFAIIRSDVNKRVIISFPGTRGVEQLVEQFINSEGVAFFNKKNVKIIKFFRDLYDKIESSVTAGLQKMYKIYPDYQYIFTGHSLGAAMATIFAVTSIENKTIAKTDDSPVLITYGQPRTGNDIFANWVMENIPIVFRVVRDGDIVTTIPSCSSDFFSSTCNSILPKFTFQQKLRLSRSESKKIKSKWRPWHIGGLKLFKEDLNSFKSCGTSFGENNPRKDCRSSISIDFDMHKFYFHQIKVSQICLQ